MTAALSPSSGGADLLVRDFGLVELEHNVCCCCSPVVSLRPAARRSEGSSFASLRDEAALVKTRLFSERENAGHSSRDASHDCVVSRGGRATVRLGAAARTSREIQSSDAAVARHATTRADLPRRRGGVAWRLYKRSSHTVVSLQNIALWFH